MSKQFADSNLPETLFDPEILYNLLPALYLEKDQQQGESLRALLAVLNQEFSAIARDVQHLYDNWFIETCDEWVVPYIADLVGVSGLVDESHLAYSQRARVANTLRYRQHKGTPATLEQAAKDSTGWTARAVEGFAQLAITQSLNHPRPDQETISLRNQTALDELSTPFSAIAHSIDVRPLSATPMTTPTRLTQGGYNLRELTLFLWRLQSYPVTCSTPAANESGGYSFHPLGVATPLFNSPLTSSITSIAANQRVRERNVPAPLRRHPLQAAIASLQQGNGSQSGYFNDQPVFQIWVRPQAGQLESGQSAPQPDFRAMPATAMHIADLREWQRPGNISEGIEAIVDPILGRLMPTATDPMEIRVSYAYGFSADLGGGPYDRQSSLASSHSQSSNSQSSTQLWQAIVSEDAMAAQTQLPDGRYVFQSFAAALEVWVASGKSGTIEILDNGTYGTSDTEYLIIPAEARSLVIQSSNGTCPCILGNWQIGGNRSGTSVTLNGLWLDGQLMVRGNLQLNLHHCTLKPPVKRGDGSQPRSSIQSIGNTNVGLQVAITRCITGPIYLLPEMAGLWVQDSIIDGGKEAAIAAPSSLFYSAHSYAHPYSAPAVLKRSTIFGKVFLSSLVLASDVLFVDPVYVQHRQVGALRFCYLPPDSQPPRCYHCQPELAMHGQSEDIRTAIAAQLKPTFTAVEYGQPGYAQLSLGSPLEIRAGGTQGSEMGAFHHLYQFQREVHLSEILREYLPSNLSPGVVYVT